MHLLEFGDDSPVLSSKLQWYLFFCRRVPYIKVIPERSREALLTYEGHSQCRGLCKSLCLFQHKSNFKVWVLYPENIWCKTLVCWSSQLCIDNSKKAHRGILAVSGGCSMTNPLCSSLISTSFCLKKIHVGYVSLMCVLLKRKLRHMENMFNKI